MRSGDTFLRVRNSTYRYQTGGRPTNKNRILVVFLKLTSTGVTLIKLCQSITYIVYYNNILQLHNYRDICDQLVSLSPPPSALRDCCYFCSLAIARLFQSACTTVTSARMSGKSYHFHFTYFLRAALVFLVRSMHCLRTRARVAAV